MSKFATTVAVALVLGGTTLLATQALAAMTQCWKCVGGWCCY